MSALISMCGSKCEICYLAVTCGTFFTYLHVAGTSQKKGDDRGLMKFGEDIILIDRTNLFHNFIAQSHHFFYQFLFRLFHIKLEKFIIIFITANFSALW